MAKKADSKAKEAILTLMRERFERANTYDNKNYDEMEDDVKFSFGGRYQWDRATYEQRLNDNRPALTINRLKAPIRQVANEIRLNKPSIKANPVDDKGDKKIAEIYDGMIRGIERTSQAQVAYQTAAEGAIRAGFGVFEIRNEYEDEETFEQDIKIERILNQFAVHFDPSAKKITKEDAMYCFVEDVVTEEEYKRRWPDAELVDFEGSSQTYWVIDENIRIARYYVKEMVKKNIAITEEGEVWEVTQEQIDSGVLEGVNIKKTRTAKVPKVKCYVVSGADILEGPFDIPSKFIPVVPVYGEETWVEGQNKPTGIVRDAKDPQKLYNYWRTTAAETIALQPKVPYLVTPGMIKALKPMWDNANHSNKPYLMYNPDQGQKPFKEPPPSPPAAMWQESAIASDDIKFTTGIFDSGLGNVGPEQSGRAILARQQKSEISNFIYTDNLAIAIQYAGRILVDMIPKVYDTQRIVRVIGIDDAEDLVPINQKLPTGEIINDLTAGKYDVTVNVGPSYQTKRAEAADSMMSFASAVPGVAANIADLIAKNMDWPGAEAIEERIKKTMPSHLIEESDDEKTPAQQQAQEIQAQQFQKDQEAKQSIIDLNTAKANSQRAGAVLDFAKAKETLSGIDQQELENLFRVLQATGGNTGQQ